MTQSPTSCPSTPRALHALPSGTRTVMSASRPIPRLTLCSTIRSNLFSPSPPLSGLGLFGHAPSIILTSASVPSPLWSVSARPFAESRNNHVLFSLHATYTLTEYLDILFIGRDSPSSLSLFSLVPLVILLVEWKDFTSKVRQRQMLEN